MCLDRIDGGAGHGHRQEVLESVAVVHAVVAEAAEIGITEGGRRIAEGMTGRRAEPEGGIAADGNQEAEIGRGVDRREELAAGQVSVTVETEFIALLAHHGAQCAAGLGNLPVQRGRLHGGNAIIHLDFLVQR